MGNCVDGGRVIERDIEEGVSMGECWSILFEMSWGVSETFRLGC